MKAYILISVRTGQITEVVKQLNTLDTVIEAYMTFGPYDAVAKVQANDMKHMGYVIDEEIQPIPGVLETLTCLAVE